MKPSFVKCNLCLTHIIRSPLFPIHTHIKQISFHAQCTQFFPDGIESRECLVQRNVFLKLPVDFSESVWKLATHQRCTWTVLLYHRSGFYCKNAILFFLWIPNRKYLNLNPTCNRADPSLLSDSPRSIHRLGKYIDSQKWSPGYRHAHWLLVSILIKIVHIWYTVWPTASSDNIASFPCFEKWEVLFTQFSLTSLQALQAAQI